MSWIIIFSDNISVILIVPDFILREQNHVRVWKHLVTLQILAANALLLILHFLCRSYLTPVRDEEAESLRKARSRQARQTRRSTQVSVTSLFNVLLFIYLSIGSTVEK